MIKKKLKFTQKFIFLSLKLQIHPNTLSDEDLTELIRQELSERTEDEPNIKIKTEIK